MLTFPSMFEKNLLLVSSIEKFPCLYNHNLHDYMKKDITEKAWNEVALQTSLSVPECKEKWRNLRYSLLRSLKPNADGTNKKKYYLHKEMEFLIPFMKLKATGFMPQFEEEIYDDLPNESCQDVTSPQQHMFEYEFLNAENTRPINKRKRNSHVDPFSHIQANYDCDSRKQFMLGLMPEVNALTEDQMKVFRRKILVLLDDITENSSVEEENEKRNDRNIKSEPTENDESNNVVYTIT